MNKIFIVAGREFFTRIQSRTFIVMSILGPLLFGLFVLVPVLMAKWNNDSTTVWVHDPSGQLSDAFQDQNGLKFQVLPKEPSATESSSRPIAPTFGNFWRIKMPASCIYRLRIPT
jgi:hypothetical protein